jgi:hypothetical protein
MRLTVVISRERLYKPHRQTETTALFGLLVLYMPCRRIDKVRMVRQPFPLLVRLEVGMSP